MNIEGLAQIGMPLLVMLLLAVAVWALSIKLRDVSIVDSLWSIFFIVFTVLLAWRMGSDTTAAYVLIGLILLWGLRLSGYITVRNHGKGEDRRYQAIRARNQPHFEWKSFYLVFVLQAVLAWIVSLSLLAALAGASPWGWLDTVGVCVVLLGFVFETLGDLQLARFKADAANHGRVMNTGLWRYTRHPNYFGDFCVWWGFFLIALSAGGWWAIVSPLLMSVLLMKVSGVTLLEQDIAERRPGYRDYVERTPAFFPEWPKP